MSEETTSLLDKAKTLFQNPENVKKVGMVAGAAFGVAVVVLVLKAANAPMDLEMNVDMSGSETTFAAK